MKSLVLTGFMGTGKSTVGRALAERLQMPLVDLDAVIVQEQQMTIADIFSQYGEETFRKLEHIALCQYAAQQDIILSPGGGAVLQADNRAVLKAHSLVIHLTARPEIILQRVDHDSTVRPLLEQRPPEQTKLQRIEQLLEQRKVFYQQADLQLDASDQTVEELVQKITDWLIERSKEVRQ